MATKRSFQLKILSEKTVLYFGDAEVLFVPTKKEEIAIMSHHTPMIMVLGTGNVSVIEERKKNLITKIKSGIVYVGENEVSVLVDE